MDSADLRRIALSLPEAEEKSHFGKADFRVRNRIFATLPADDLAVVKLTPDEQEALVGAEPDKLRPVKGGWGRQGWTEVALHQCDEAMLTSLLTAAWRNAAPASLRKAEGAGARPATAPSSS